MAILEIFKVASPLLVRVTACAALMVFTAWLAKVSDVGERLTTGAMPVPFKVTAGRRAEVLLFKLSEPLPEPRAAGAKVTLKVQLAPAARDAPQLLVWAKSPVITKALIESVVFPVLLKVTAWAALEVPTSCEAKVSDEGENAATAPNPVPVKLTGAGAVLLLLVSDKEPVRLPTEIGAKTTLMVQLAPAPSDVPQLLVWLKSPATVSEVIVSAVFPLLVSVMVCAALEVPTSCEAKVRDEGENAATAARPVPLKLTGAGGVLLLLDNDNDPVRLPSADGLKTTLMVQLAPAA